MLELITAQHIFIGNAIFWIGFMIVMEVRIAFSDDPIIDKMNKGYKLNG